MWPRDCFRLLLCGAVFTVGRAYNNSGGGDDDVACVLVPPVGLGVSAIIFRMRAIDAANATSGLLVVVVLVVGSPEDTRLRAVVVVAAGALFSSTTCPLGVNTRLMFSARFGDKEVVEATGGTGGGRGEGITTAGDNGGKGGMGGGARE